MVERYGKAANNSRLVCAYIGDQLDRDEHQFDGLNNPMIEKLYERMRNCASWLTFREYVDLDKTILKSAKFCSKHLLCQACAIRRGANLLQAYVPRIEKVLSSSPDLTPWMITFTVKNGSNLLERHNHLKNNVSRLLNNRKCYLKGNRGFSFTEMSKVSGGVFAFEEPKSKDGETWHPHIHMLAICTDKPDVGYVNPKTGEGHGLRKEWFDLTGDSFQVDVRRKEDQPIIEMACEVMKYAVKFSEQDPEDTWKAFQVLSNQRLIRSFGSLYGVKVSKSMTDNVLSGPYIDRIFSYVAKGHYEQIAKIDCTELYDTCSYSVDSELTHGAATRKQGVWTESTP